MNRKQRRAAAKAQAQGGAGSPRSDRRLMAAVSHQRAGRLAEAGALCSQILAKEPRHGDVEAAVETFETVVALQPDYAGAYNNMGNALRGLGRLGHAEAAYQKAITLKPDYTRAHFSLSSVKTERAVMTASDVQVRRPIYASSIGRWRNYEKHLAPLIEALGRA